MARAPALPPTTLRRPRSADAALATVALGELAPGGTDRHVARVHKLSRVLDRYMLDPIVGLIIPGGGDILGSLVGMYAIGLAARRRMSPVIIARMLLNLTVDSLLGLVPFVGDLADFGFRANLRNVDLLVARTERGGRATWRDWLAVGGAALLFVATVALVVYAWSRVFRRLW